jgi:hypothetical protein
VPRTASALSRKVVFASLVIALAVPALALARTATSHSVHNGFYSGLVGVASSDVEFHVRSSGKRITDLTLGCEPTVASQAMTTVDIAVHPPALHIVNGHFSYHGAARITEDAAGTPTIATTTLSISATHVTGPVHYYSFGGHRLHQTTAFKGTATSPACTKLPRGGKFTLFGPVAGE